MAEARFKQGDHFYLDYTDLCEVLAVFGYLTVVKHVHADPPMKCSYDADELESRAKRAREITLMNVVPGSQVLAYTSPELHEHIKSHHYTGLATFTSKIVFHAPIDKTLNVKISKTSHKVVALRVAAGSQDMTLAVTQLKDTNYASPEVPAVVKSINGIAPDESGTVTAALTSAVAANEMVPGSLGAILAEIAPGLTDHDAMLARPKVASREPVTYPIIKRRRKIRRMNHV